MKRRKKADNTRSQFSDNDAEFFGRFDPKAKPMGLYRKYNVTRTDGSSAKGGKHADCAYFVLDITHDPYAIPALEAYAKACEDKYPFLAADLYKIVKNHETKCSHCGQRVLAALNGEGK